ncbi:NYN domain-containing protein [Scytonema sp. UIC 10036]|uniref:LabA-like NYN domain-containing protein n=1 Tax=Scytonema sp. UIC 10036 TaxID=2304196 RepID=UPI0012DAD8A2|nr:NYN domain-containing protein [Scytonema sp. UIC 10036]MUG97230.1 NYN domain-containing protein [Scytonema sp. UIC 10036]
MKLTQAFPIAMAASMACILTGTISKQPLLRGLGEIAALGAISRKILANQSQLDENNQKQLTQLTKENTCLQAKLANAQSELDKLEKKVKTQNTCQRLYLSKIDKLQHQQKVIVGNLAQLREKLENKTVPQSKNQPKISQKPTQPSSVELFPDVPTSVTRVYIDGNNLSFALDSLHIEVDYNALRVELSQNTTATSFKYYTGVFSPMTEGQKRFMSYLEHLRYEVIGLPILPRPDSHSVKTVGDDVKIVVDMLREVKQQDKVILVSGDGDFIPAIAEIQRRGATVTVVAKKGMLSQQLSEIANDVILLDNIQYKIAKCTKVNVA